jgi:hypothetical protein
VERSRSYCCSKNITTSSVCTVHLSVAVNNKKYGVLLMASVCCRQRRNSCLHRSVLTTFEVSQQIFISRQYQISRTTKLCGVTSLKTVLTFTIVTAQYHVTFFVRVQSTTRHKQTFDTNLFHKVHQYILLYNGYRVSFPGVKLPGRGVNQPLLLAPRLQKWYSYISTPLLALHGVF